MFSSAIVSGTIPILWTRLLLAGRWCYRSEGLPMQWRPDLFGLFQCNPDVSWPGTCVKRTLDARLRWLGGGRLPLSCKHVPRSYGRVRGRSGVFVLRRSIWHNRSTWQNATTQLLHMVRSCTFTFPFQPAMLVYHHHHHHHHWILVRLLHEEHRCITVAKLLKDRGKKRWRKRRLDAVKPDRKSQWFRKQTR